MLPKKVGGTKSIAIAPAIDRLLMELDNDVIKEDEEANIYE